MDVLEEVGIVPKVPAVERARKEDGGHQQAWGPGVEGRLKWAE